MKNQFEILRELIVKNPIIKVTHIGYTEIKLILEQVERKLIELNYGNNAIKKCYFVSYELLHNALIHGKQQVAINFEINGDSDNFHILSENLIYTDEIQRLNEKLVKVNSLTSKEEMKDYYRNIIREGRLGVGGAGLGFVDIRRKSDSKLIYNFSVLENNLTLFSIISTINVND